MKKLLLQVITLSAFASLSSFSAFAQVTDTWNGTGADWNTVGDWNSAIPTSLDTAVFSSTGNANLSVGINSPSFAKNIQFGTGAGEYILGSTSGSTITLTNGGTTGITFGNLPLVIETIDAPLILGDNSVAGETYTFANSAVAADVLNFNGSISGAAGTGNTTTLTFNEITSTINGVIGDGANGGHLAITTGTNGVNLTLTAAETYTGSTTLKNNAVVTLSGSGAFGNTAIFDQTQATLNLNTVGGVSQNLLTVNGGTLNVGATNAIDGTAAVLVSGSGLFNLTLPQDYSGNTTVSNEGINNGGTMTVSGTGSLASPTVTVGTSGTINLNSSNALAASVVHAQDGGILNVTATNAITGTSSLNVTNGVATISAPQNYTGTTHVAGGYFAPNTQPLAGTPNLIINGTGALGNTAVTVDESTAYPGYLELDAPGAISQNTLTVTGATVLEGTANNVTYVWTPYDGGAITGTTTVTINESTNGAYGTIGEAYFGGGNTYTGVTTLNGTNNNVTINVDSLGNGGGPGSLGSSSNAASNLIFGGGTLQATQFTSAQSTDRLFTITGNGSRDSATLDSSSVSSADTMSFTNTGAIVSGGAPQYITPTLNLTGSNTGANTFAPLLSNLYNTYNAATVLTKTGVGNWILTNANTFSGATTISAGTLQLNNVNALQDSTVSLGAANGLTFGGAGTYLIRGLTGSSNESLASGVVLQFSNALFPTNNYISTYTYSGSLSGQGGVLMGGFLNGNIEALTVDNTYSGGSTVNGGTLESTDPSTSGTPFGTGPVTLNGGYLSFIPTGSSAIVDNIGAVTYTGGGTMILNKGTNTSLTVNATSFTDGGTGTLVLQTHSADLSTGENVTAGTAPALNSGLVNAPIVGYNGTNLDLLTYGAGGFTDATALYTNLAAPSGPSTTFTTTSNEIVNVTAGNPYSYENGQAILVGSAAALRTASGAFAAIKDGTTYTVGDGTDPAVVALNSTGYYGSSGGIVIVNSNTTSFLNFAGSQGDIFVNGWNQIDPIVEGTNGLVLGGAGGDQVSPNGVGGALQLSNNHNTFSGGLTVNEGATLVYTATSNLSYGTKFTNGEMGDPNNIVTLDGGAIYSNNSYFGIGRTINLTTAGGYLTGNDNVVSNITGSGNLTVGAFQNGGSSPFANNPSVVDLTGNNTFTGGLNLYNNFTVVSSNNNLGAATGAVNIDGGFISIAGTTMNNFGSHVVTITTNTNVAFDIQNANNTFTLNTPINTLSNDLYKMGAGTLVVTNGGTYQGQTQLLGGTLRLDETNGSSVRSTKLTFAGGTLDVLGATTGATVQNFTGSLPFQSYDNVFIGETQQGVTMGGGELLVDSNIGDGTQSTTVNLGTFQQGIGGHAGTSTSGGALDIAVAGNGTSTITTLTAPDASTGTGSSPGIYGARVVYTSASGVTNWATSNSVGTPYAITGYNAYDTFNGDIGSDVTSNDIQAGGHTFSSASPTTVNSLKITGSGTLNLNGNNLNLTSGGLLFTGNGAYTISDSVGGGSLTSGLVSSSNAGSASDLIIQDYSASTLTISAVIANGTGASTLTKAGPGTLVLSGVNTYTGQTFIDGGILSISALNNISSATLDIDGGALEVTSSLSLSGRTINVGSDGATFNATGSNVLTIGDLHSMNGNQGLNSGALTINGDGSTGTVALATDFSGINIYGGINIGGGTLRISGGAFNTVSNNNQGDSSPLGANPSNYLTFTGTSGDLQLNGTPGLVAGLVSASTNSVVEDGNTSNLPTILAVGNGDNETYAGTLVNNVNPALTGKLSFLKTGSGTLSFTNANSSYTGTTELDGGILNVASITNEGAGGGTNSSIGASSNAASNLIFGGGTLQYTGSTAQTTDRLFTLGDTGVGGNNGAIDASGTGSGTVTFSNTGAVTVANTGVHNLTLTGTNTGANTFALSLGDGTFNATPFATSLTKTGTGTWTTTNANTYSGGTQVLAGTLYVNGGSVDTSSGTGTGAVLVAPGASLGGSGVVGPTIPGAGITMQAHSTLISGGVQAVVSPTTTAGPGLTLDNRVAAGVILDASVGSADLTFSLGAGNIIEPNIYDFANPNMHSTFMTVLGNTLGELKFASGDTITVNDLTGVGNLQVNLGTPYLLITAGTTPGLLTDNELYTGLVTSGGVIGGVIQNGFVENLSLNGTITSNNGPVGLYLYNGQLEVVPEPGTWALMLAGLVALVLFQRRNRKLKID